MTRSLSRRWLLGVIGGGSAGYAAGALAEPARGVSNPSGKTAPGNAQDFVADRQALARLPDSPGAAWRVADPAGAGLWSWREGDFAARIRADPRQGLYVQHADVPPTRGVWAREWDGITGRPEWFGARANEPSVDNQPALQAALDLCPAVQLAAGSYFVTRRLHIVKNGTRLLGAGITQTDQGPNDNCSQIVSTSADGPILQIGSDSATQPAPLVECVQVRDVTIRRAVAPFVPAAGFAGAVGIAMRWCVNCHIERVFSIDSARGWLFYGTIENYVVRCAALRGRTGSNGDTDFFIGFHLDYTAPLAANGGNASLYIDHCRAFGGFGEGTPALKYSAGLRTDGGWVDLFVNALETGTLHYGIHGNGDAYGTGTSLKTEDVTITNCVLDQSYDAAIRLETGDASAAVQIANNYCAVTPSGASIVLYQIAGSVSVTANQCIIGPVGGTGLSAVRVNNLRCMNNIYTKLKQPIRLEGVTNFQLHDTIQSLDTPNSYASIALIGCTRGRVDCILSGRPGANARGVDLVGSGNSLIEVNCTTVQPSLFPGRDSGKLTVNGTPVTVAGPFGNKCLAIGIMS